MTKKATNKKVIKSKKVKKAATGQDKVAQVMREFKEGKLKDRGGKTVTDRKQAIAIAMNEAGLSWKELHRSEILNKIKVYKYKLENMIQKQLEKNDNIQQKIADFFRDNPDVTDKDVHSFAEKNGIASDKLENIIYNFMSSFFGEGKSKGNLKKFDENKIMEGVNVELEHTTNPIIARKIAIDHLIEDENYYDKLKTIEKAKTVEGYLSPEPGKLSEKGSDILAKVYSKCRADGGNKEKCAKIAWSAVRGAGYKSLNKSIKLNLKKELESYFVQKKKIEKAWQLKSGKWHDYDESGKVIEVPAPDKKGKKEEEKKEYFTNEKDKEKELNDISNYLEIPKENIFIHSTLQEGLKDLIEKRTDDYLSTSTIQGSKKFLEKEGNNIFTILNAEKKDIDFQETGDVGFKGGTTKKTSYDETGLKNWDLKSFYIPSYYDNNIDQFINTIIARDYLDDTEDIYLPIFTKNKELLNKVDNAIYDIYQKYKNKFDYNDITEKILNREIKIKL